MDAIRCFSCGKVLGGKIVKYCQLIQETSCENAMNELNIKRSCCRRMVFSRCDVSQKILDYNQVHDTMSNNQFVKNKTTAVFGEKRTYIAR